MNRTLLIPALVALAFAASPSFAAVEHSHEHAQVQELTLDHGRKWPTDETLRTQMEGLRTALAKHQRGDKHAPLSRENARALGLRVEQGVVTILRECRLGPDADRNLHVIVAELVQSSDVLQGKVPGDSAEATRRARHALEAYGRHFEHPGWKRLS